MDAGKCAVPAARQAVGTTEANVPKREFFLKSEGSFPNVSPIMIARLSLVQ
jgi:hypothetical protein